MRLRPAGIPITAIAPVVLATCALGYACGDATPVQPPVGPSPPPTTTPTPTSTVTEEPTTLPSRTPLEESIKTIYLREFGEPIFRPAIFNDPRSASCSGKGHVTSTVYLDSEFRDGDSRLMVLYTSRDGTQLISKTGQPGVVKPAGRFRVLVALLAWPEIIDAESLPDWEAAQARVNREHEAFARSKGYGEAIVSFESTNVLIPGREVSNPNTQSGIVEAL